MARAKRKAAKPKSADVSAMPHSMNENLSIRKITNGYLVRHSKQDKNGGYSETETYVAKRPDLKIPKGK